MFFHLEHLHHVETKQKTPQQLTNAVINMDAALDIQNARAGGRGRYIIRP